MVNDPTTEREKIGDNDPLGDPSEGEPGTRREGMPENPDSGKEDLPPEEGNR